MGHGFGTRLPLCRALKGEQWSDRLRLRVRGYSRLRPEQEQWLNGYKNKMLRYAVYKRLTSDLGHLQTESEGMENDILCKWKSKESWSSNTHVR